MKIYLDLDQNVVLSQSSVEEHISESGPGSSSRPNNKGKNVNTPKRAGGLPRKPLAGKKGPGAGKSQLAGHVESYLYDKKLAGNATQADVDKCVDAINAMTEKELSSLISKYKTAGALGTHIYNKVIGEYLEGSRYNEIEPKASKGKRAPLKSRSPLPKRKTSERPNSKNPKRALKSAPKRGKK